jgi:hypothetical protein
MRRMVSFYVFGILCNVRWLWGPYICFFIQSVANVILVRESCFTLRVGKGDVFPQPSQISIDIL